MVAPVAVGRAAAVVAGLVAVVWRGSTAHRSRVCRMSSRGLFADSWDLVRRRCEREQ